MRSSGAMLSCNSVFSHDINYTESSNDSTELICKSITIFCEKDFIEKSEEKNIHDGYFIHETSSSCSYNEYVNNTQVLNKLLFITLHLPPS